MTDKYHNIIYTNNLRTATMQTSIHNTLHTMWQMTVKIAVLYIQHMYFSKLNGSRSFEPLACSIYWLVDLVCKTVASPCQSHSPTLLQYICILHLVVDFGQYWSKFGIGCAYIHNWLFILIFSTLGCIVAMWVSLFSSYPYRSPVSVWVCIFVSK